MDTFAARLASFDLVLQPEKRRSSSAKTVKPITWPHSNPSPAELAHAGFYYNPYETNPDNTTCFLCNRALDGWEEDDNPITEHLKHARDCGWAVMMDIQQRSSNPAEIEDPTSEKIADARRSTFGEAWPHDGKKGWVCQSEKMVEGGWYFCPTEESNDLASCAYCKLSLDGWEPKDDPYDEHYRRSSDCSFFVFARPPNKKLKSSKAKKPRTSKASRLSTQSIATTVSEAAVDVNDMADESTTSQPPAKAKPSKKTTKPKAKSAKSKKQEVADVDSQMDLDSVDYQHSEPLKPKRAGRGKKRQSEDMIGVDLDQVERDIIEQIEPPTKKRATKARVSVVSQEPEAYDFIYSRAGSPEQEESVPEKEEPKKGRKASKKETSKSRKAAETTSLTKPALMSQETENMELDSVPVSDREGEMGDPEPQAIDPKPKNSAKSKSAKKSKKTPDAHDKVDNTNEETEQRREESQPDEELEEAEVPVPKTKSAKGTKRKTTKKQKAQEEESVHPLEERVSLEKDTRATADRDSTHQESFVSVEIINKEPEYESDADSHTASKESQKKSQSAEKKRGRKSNHAAVDSPVHADVDMAEASEPQTALEEPETPQIEEKDTKSKQEPRRRSSNMPPKTTERYSDIPEEKQLAKSITKIRISDASISRHDVSLIPETSSPVVSPLAAPVESTPSRSPQASDAENQPPSTLQYPVLSPSKNRTVRVPLAANTPSPSKRNVLNPGRLKSLHPWIPIDIEEILMANSSDKENIDIRSPLHGTKGELTSPEKKMTVEEWILWNAKKGEEKLKHECERLVSQFEKEGGRAMRALEGIECID
ncbi:hypothetical protein ASPZODRAFT_2117030 [Penicilliopsis zonata CBS 506.65]|uniref:BIR-domain-containing protein n=1 Tax=Penicilliopsis zonata CBS 506.65 TaxID=1073090 RepID=A0A1L9SS52_9EURO|nr:hypothetical protein ASPZODRAFT_2117030 [Penicilliopsis zonata CBS 506.65]OJJ50030.1 hypothetical protein ASPZODRAFT_2117030 [Penicilliopsis zonata CBS 506.65]